MSFKFSHPLPGEIIDNPSPTGLLYYSLNEKYTVQKSGPTLLFSNSPEKVKEPGILYRDQVEGPTRVMYHHKNDFYNSTLKQKLLVVATNTGEKPVNLTKTKASFGGPVADVLHLGQQVALKYMASNEREVITIQPGEKICLNENSHVDWKYEQTLTGMLDFETDGPLTITIAALSAKTNLANLTKLPVLQRDEHHIRGTFPQADRIIEVTMGAKKQQIVIGKEEGFETWARGYDYLTGEEVVNRGNYGLVYKVVFSAKTKTGILLNPRGTKFKGAFQGFDGEFYKAPAVGTFYGSEKAAVTGVVKEGQTATLIYIPPNGSDTPVIFGLIPEKYWQ